MKIDFGDWELTGRELALISAFLLAVCGIGCGLTHCIRERDALDDYRYTQALLVGKRVATVSPTYTSQTDCLTGKRDGTRQGTRYYTVGGKVYDADWNAAINIVNRYKHSVSFIEPVCGTLNFIRQGAVNLPIVRPSSGKPRVL